MGVFDAADVKSCEVYSNRIDENTWIRWRSVIKKLAEDPWQETGTLSLESVDFMQITPRAASDGLGQSAAIRLLPLPSIAYWNRPTRSNQSLFHTIPWLTRFPGHSLLAWYRKVRQVYLAPILVRICLTSLTSSSLMSLLALKSSSLWV